MCWLFWKIIIFFNVFLLLKVLRWSIQAASETKPEKEQVWNQFFFHCLIENSEWRIHVWKNSSEKILPQITIQILQLVWKQY